jgi:hypothetical protein
VGVAACVRFIKALPGVPHQGDLTDYVAAGGTRESLLTLIREVPELTKAEVAKCASPESICGVHQVTHGQRPRICGCF